MARSVPDKMGLRPGMRAYLADVPESVLGVLPGAGLDVSESLGGDFDYIHLFARTQAGMDEQFPRLAAHLRERGMLWVSWPKGGGLGTDLSLPHVIRIGYSHGLVESTTLSVDPTWSAMKFTHPRPGTVYRNSYGRLPSDGRPRGEPTGE
jgi:hypothetical protein